ncbi:hypothetical protein PI125_g4741 [Phytophthora idaei]|nr:hypothetical protein PI125_g4741 [Phytophthora idaei]
MEGEDQAEDAALSMENDHIGDLRRSGRRRFHSARARESYTLNKKQRKETEHAQGY